VPRSASDSRARILHEAARLFKAKGYAGTTMDEVAAAAKRNKATVYHYFESKAELLYTIYIESAAVALETVRSLPADMPADEAVAKLIQAHLESIRERPNESAVYFHEMAWIKEWLPKPLYKVVREKEALYVAELEALLTRGQRNGTLRDIDLVAAAQVVTGVISWVSRGRATGPPLTDLSTQVADILLYGLLARE